MAEEFGETKEDRAEARREEHKIYVEKEAERKAHEAHAKTTHEERAEEARAKEKSDYQTGLAE